MIAAGAIAETYFEFCITFMFYFLVLVWFVYWQLAEASTSQACT
jgi:hypothetical protein